MTKRIIQQRKRIFIAGEGESEQSFIKWLQQISDKEGLHIHGSFENRVGRSPAFIKGVREQLFEAKITFDKFHILEIINEAVDEVRRMSAKGNPLLKGTWI